MLSDGNYKDVTAGNFTSDHRPTMKRRPTSILLSLDPSTVEESEGSLDGSTRVDIKGRCWSAHRATRMTTMTLRINDSNNNIISQEILDNFGIGLDDFATEEVDFTLPAPDVLDLRVDHSGISRNLQMIELFFDLVDDNVDEGVSETLVISGEVISGEAETLDVARPVIIEISKTTTIAESRSRKTSSDRGGRRRSCHSTPWCWTSKPAGGRGSGGACWRSFRLL